MHNNTISSRPAAKARAPRHPSHTPSPAAAVLSGRELRRIIAEMID